MNEIKKGKITKIIFNNSENGYTVALFETENEMFTIVGNFHEVKINTKYVLSGKFKKHRKYGEQFNIETYKETVPEGSEEILTFLKSGTVKGIGEKTAELIVNKFGNETLSIMKESPEKLTEIKGIGKMKAKKIALSYRESIEFSEIFMELSKIGIDLSNAVKIYKIYGKNSVNEIKRNPYVLIDTVKGISFRNADKIALKSGLERTDEFRLESGIKYVMQVFTSSGNTYIPKSLLIEKALEILEVDSAQINDEILAMTFAGDLQTDLQDGEEIVYLYEYYLSEQRVAYNIKRIKEAESKDIEAEIHNLIADAENTENTILSEEQREAVEMAVKENISIITGGPGTGKTTIINIIVRIFLRMNRKVAIAAPTGRAAKRITETSGFPAMTIHRLLEYVYSEDENEMHFERNSENPIEEDVIIIDEASMVDLMLMDGLLKAIKENTSLIIVGDADQLPSVGAGNVLRDMINSEYIPVTRLKRIFRQKDESLIAVNAHMINDGEFPYSNEKDKDFFMISRDDDKSMLAEIKDLFMGRLENYYDFISSKSDIQIITPTKKGTLGTVNLNREIQAVVNPQDGHKPEINIGMRIFRIGDRVMQIRNNYLMEWKDKKTYVSGTGVFNGDMGVIIQVDNENMRIKVDYDGRVVEYLHNEFDELVLAYAVTVHKSQGSEFPVAIIPMTYFPPMLMTRKLLYTAVTRAKKLVVIVGRSECMQRMIINNNDDKRYTGLAYRLKEKDRGVF